MIDKQTSDERLLKIIEGGGSSKGKQVITPGVRRAPINLMPGKFNLAWLKSTLKNLKINLPYLNKGLIGLAVLLTLVFLYTIFSAPVVSKSNATFFAPADASAVVKLISAGQAQGLVRKNILSQDIKRDFFLPFGTKSSSPVQEAGADLTEEFKTLKLVGIIWSKNPEVMIENSKDSRTYILKAGDSLDDQFKVKEVSRNSATLEVVTQEGSKEYVLR